MHMLRYRRDDGYIALVMIMMIRVMQCNNDDDDQMFHRDTVMCYAVIQIR